jgi:hypothetical protein
MSVQEDMLFKKVKGYLGGRTKFIRNFRPKWLRNPKTGKRFTREILWRLKGTQPFVPL